MDQSEAGKAAAGRDAHTRYRPPSLEEALAYSPVTSILPFNPEILSAPSASPPIACTSFTSTKDREVGKAELNSLNRLAQESPTSVRLEQTLKHLGDLLQADSLTQYKFVKPPGFAASDSSTSKPSKKRPSPSVVDELSPFAKIVLKRSNVEFAYAKGPAASAKPRQQRTPSTTPSTTQSPIPRSHLKVESRTPTIDSKHRPSPARSAYVEITSDTTPKPERTPSQTPNQPPGVGYADIQPSAPSAIEHNASMTINPSLLMKAPPPPPIPQVVIPPSSSPLSSVPPSSAPQPNSSQPYPSQESAPPSQIAPPSQQPREPLVRTQSNGNHMIVIQPILSASEEEYVADPSIDAGVASRETYNISRKRVHDEMLGGDGYVPMSVDVRQKANADLHSLLELIEEVLEAENGWDPEAPQNNASRFFITGASWGDSDAPASSVPRLLPQIQAKLDKSMQTVISAKRFQEVSAESLVRIQRMCEASIARVERLSLLVSGSWTDQDVEEWIRNLAAAEHGMQGAKLLLRIMCAGREEKVLYSEHLVRQILDSVKHVLEMSLLPAVETRSTDSQADAFRILASHKKPLSNLMAVVGRVFRLLGDLVAKVDVAETAINAVEDTAVKLIFVENAHAERESALGTQKYETLRRTAMDTLARVFAKYSEMRQGIFNDILTSLERLPVQRQSARQYRLIEGKPIQLVSALLMRLVQMAGTPPREDTRRRRSAAASAHTGSDEDESEIDDEPAPKSRQLVDVQPIDLDMAGDMPLSTAMKELWSLSTPLFVSAQQSARHLVGFLVSKALGATKTGDTPFRNLLDIFVEDFLNVLGHAEWPAAELLLQTLLTQMVVLVESDKMATNAKVMALDLMGLMGSGISDVQLYVQHNYRSLDTRDSDLSNRLADIADLVLEERQADIDGLEFDGPYRTVVEFLLARENANDPQTQSARGFTVAQWAAQLLAVFEAARKRDDGADANLPRDLLLQVRNMVVDDHWLHAEYEFETVSPIQGKIASSLVALNLPFCRSFRRIFHTLLISMNSDHASIKSRSLKSVVQLLEKDPKILDKGNHVINHILRCMGDNSTMVRDSALGLLAKCLTLKPSLETEVCDRIIARSADAAAVVRKRVMKILKDIYLRNNSEDVKAAIADALLQRIRDTEESIVEAAKQTFEEIWIIPFADAKGPEEDPHMHLRLKKQVALIVKTVQRGDGVLPVLESLLQNALSPQSKNSVTNNKVCKSMVATMFDAIIDNDSAFDELPQHNILQTMSVFAKASPTLFTADQLKLLEPYIKNLLNTDDLLIYRSVISIFRYTMPSLSSLQRSFLENVQQALLSSVAKLGKGELEEVASCLWIIDSVLENTERLIRLVVSVIRGIGTKKLVNFNDAAQRIELNRVKRYIMIAGYFGKACDFEKYLPVFKKQLGYPGTSVSSIIVDVLIPFAKTQQPSAMREAALESIGMICQAWPQQFNRQDVTKAFDLVFINDDQKLKYVVLHCIRDFFAAEEQRSESGAEIKVGEGAKHGQARLQKSLAANENDGASTCLAQNFLRHILKLALAKPDEHAYLATQIIASINRQGLVHPKECGPALIALETSPHERIAAIAFQEHRSLHEKHESMFEKEYMKAVNQAFAYQSDVLEDPSGTTGQPPVAKMKPLYEVLKIGSSKVRKRFLQNISARCDFEPAKFRGNAEGSRHGQFVRFCMENLGLFDYPRVDELLHLISCMEKIVTSSGTTVAHNIETEILKMGLNNPQPANQSTHTDILMQNGIVQTNGFDQGQTNGFTPGHADLRPATPAAVDLNPDRLNTLALSAVVQMTIWETRTHLRRAWNLTKQSKQIKPTTKDLNKTPIRNPAYPHDKFLDRIAGLAQLLENRDSQFEACRSLVHLLSVDHEHRIAADPEDDDELAQMAAGYETPSDAGDGASEPGSTDKRGRKRKGSMSTGAHNGATPKWKRGRPSGSKNKIGVAGRRKSGSSEEGPDGGWD